MRLGKAVLFVFMLLLVGAVFSHFQALAGDGRQKTVTVMAAASLRESLEEIAAGFEAGHPDIRVRLNFAGSQLLKTQLEQGAEADVFASANERYLQVLAAQGLTEQPAVFAVNRMMLVVPSSNPASLHSPQDLAGNYRLVLAAENVPAGIYAREVISKLGLRYGGNFSERVMANLVSEETNVKQVLAKVALAEADAGIVYRTDAHGDLGRRVVGIPLDDSLNVAAGYYVAGVRGGDTELARTFIAYLLSPPGRKVLESYGFETSEEGTSR